MITEEFKKFLVGSGYRSAEFSLPVIDVSLITKLVERIDNIPLFAHSYAFHFNFNFGGYVGYGVRPDFRKQGYGTMMLRLCLDEARRIKMDRVLITCDEGNIGSTFNYLPVTL